MTEKTPPEDEWLRPDQVAALFGYKSKRVVYDLVARGELAGGYPLGGSKGLRIPRSEFERYSAELRTQALAEAEARRRALAQTA